MTWKNADVDTEWEYTDPDTRHDIENPLCDINNHTVKGGGDFNPECICIQSCTTDPDSWEQYDLTKAMKDFIKNQDSHFGLLLKPYRGNVGRYYSSSETTEISQRPKLKIEYSTDIIHKVSALTWDNSITVTATPTVITFSIPFAGNYTISILAVSGKEVVSLDGKGKRDYRIPVSPISSGIYITRIFLEEKIIFSKFQFIR